MRNEGRREDAEGDWEQRVEDVRAEMVEAMRNQQEEVPVKRSLVLVSAGRPNGQ